ncbi:MAG TPA: hypothetical protein VFU05_10795 [Cyclobacteriaceae bacterium]|nr:hypothetical protein [Cyclobacteriaceae bacterium]
MRELMLVIHFIGLAMALGAGFANFFLGSVAAKLEPAERGNFMAKLLILGRMGQIGLGLLLLSGFALITPFWKVLGEMPFLIAKLSLVGVLLLSVSRILFLVNKSKRENNPAVLMKVKPLGMLNFFLGITIVILAVLTFH